MATEIRKAQVSEIELLSDLALNSKAHWGYSDAFMAACRDELTVTRQQIEDGEVWVADTDAGAAGLYRLSVEGDTAEVELLFVRPNLIGSGIGRALWDHMIAEAARRGAARLYVDSDPQAEGFYRAMGCRRIGEAASASIAGRTLPRLELKLSESADA